MIEIENENCTIIIVRPTTGGPKRRHLEMTARPYFNHACKMGLEGIMSKRKDSTYCSGRSPDWLKMKNPACEALRRRRKRIGGMTHPDDALHAGPFHSDRAGPDICHLHASMENRAPAPSRASRVRNLARRPARLSYTSQGASRSMPD